MVLLMLFWVFAIFWLISDIANRRPFLCVIIVGMLYIAGIFAPSYFCLNRGLQYIIYFCAGFFIRRYDFGNKILCKIPSILYLGVDILLFASSEMLISNGAVLFKLINMLLDVLRHMCGAISAFMLLQRLINRFIPLFDLQYSLC